MAPFPEKLRLKGLADEDIYFAKKDRELIEALREKRLAETKKCTTVKHKLKAKALEKEFHSLTAKHHNNTHKRRRAYRRLLDRLIRLCSKRRSDSKHVNDPTF